VGEKFVFIVSMKQPCILSLSLSLSLSSVRRAVFLFSLGSARLRPRRRFIPGIYSLRVTS